MMWNALLRKNTRCSATRKTRTTGSGKLCLCVMRVSMTRKRRNMVESIQKARTLMKLVIQRVTSAKVEICNETVAAIGRGLLVLVGFCAKDEQKDIDRLADKLCKLRVFEDAEGKMNVSASEVGGALLLVPNFTLYADTFAGNRPSFAAAAPATMASALFDAFVAAVRLRFVGDVQTGVFQADMAVSLVNDGPVTLLAESTR